MGHNRRHLPRNPPARARAVMPVLGLASLALALAACGGSGPAPAAAAAQAKTTTSVVGAPAAPATTSPPGTAAPAATTTVPAQPLVFSGTAKISGAATFSGPYTDTADATDINGNAWASCRDFAQHTIDGTDDDGSDFKTPGPSVLATQRVTAAVSLSGPWPGPGTEGDFPGLSLNGLTLGTFTLSVGKTTYATPAQWKVKVDPDGSGKMVFSTARGTTAADAKEAISGTVTWNCSQGAVK